MTSVIESKRPGEGSCAQQGSKPDGIQPRPEVHRWKQIVARFQEPDRVRASWQLVNTIGSYVALWCAMFLSLSVSWWLTLPLAILAGGLMVRVFIDLPRLRTRVVLRVAEGQRHVGFRGGPVDLHALLPLAMAALRWAPREQRAGVSRVQREIDTEDLGQFRDGALTS